MKLIYNVEDKPKFKELIVFAFQQLLAIIASTILVPVLVNNLGVTNLHMDPSSALIGAGFGTIVYLLFTKSKSPVFLGSSFSFLPSLYAATAFGYLGILLGAIVAGLVYVVISFVVKKYGSDWVYKLMPQSVMGPTVSIIGLGLASSTAAQFTKTDLSGIAYSWAAIICALVTMLVTMYFSVKGKGFSKLIPFIVGILAGYAVACVFTLFGIVFKAESLQIINFAPLVENFKNFSIASFISVPKLALFESINEIAAGNTTALKNLGTIFVLFAPVAFVVFAEHIADHRNISSIIERDLLKDPGLDKSLLGDGVGSIVGTALGCCPNTTYGESVATVAVTKNASVSTIWATAILAIILSFFTPFNAFINTIPQCVLGGISVILYGFIAVSGLKMIQDVDLNNNQHLFTVATILILGIGGLTFKFGSITVTNVAAAMICGIIVNNLCDENNHFVENIVKKIKKCITKTNDNNKKDDTKESETIKKTAPKKKKVVKAQKKVSSVKKVSNKNKVATKKVTKKTTIKAAKRK